MKKSIALLLMAGLLLTSAFGSGSSEKKESSPDKVTLRMTYWNSEGGNKGRPLK